MNKLLLACCLALVPVLSHAASASADDPFVFTCTDLANAAEHANTSHAAAERLANYIAWQGVEIKLANHGQVTAKLAAKVGSTVKAVCSVSPAPDHLTIEAIIERLDFQSPDLLPEDAGK
jgi:hypothetical protein